MSLRLSLLSGPYVMRPGDSQPLSLASRDGAMLAWLAQMGPTTRAQMASMLWPDRQEEMARNSLRQRLFQLRRQVGDDLVIGNSTMQLAPHVRHDLHDGYGLLGDLSLPECPVIDAWMTEMRERRMREQRTVLVEQLNAQEAKGDWLAALALAEALVEIEPLSEHAHRRVMQLHYLRGDRAAALLAFDRLEKRLKDDVGTRPDASSLALLRTIEQSDPLPRAPGAGVVRPPMPPTLMRPPKIVGRDAEIAEINMHLGAGRVVALVGEAGVGKSRLLHAVAAMQPSSVIWRGRPGDSLSPYATLTRNLQTLLAGMPPGTLESLSQDVQADLVRLVPSLARRLVIQQPGLGGTPGLAVHQVLNLMYPEGTLLILDDLHFADDASVEVLQQGMSLRGRGRVLFTMRPMPRAERAARMQEWFQELVRAGHMARVVVEPLGTDALAQLVDSLELPGIDGRELAAALHHRTGGNPLFALETLKLAWHESPEHRLTNARALPSPQNVTEMITQHLSQLSESAITLARVVTLAGSDFSLPLAEAVLNKTSLDLVDAWRELECQNVIRGQTFAHDLIDEAVRLSIPEAIARQLHGRIAAWLQTNAGDAARTAAHHQAAGQADQALPALLAAADQAQHALRGQERVRFLLQAAETATAQGDQARAFDCVRQAIDAHMNMLRDTSGLPLLERMQALAATPAQRALSMQSRSYYHANIGQWQLAVQHGEEAVKLSLIAGDESISAMSRQRLGVAHAMTGNFEQALENLLPIESWIAKSVTAPERQEYYGNVAVAFDNVGRLDEARTMHMRAVSAADGPAYQHQRARHLGNLVVNRLNAGALAEAREHCAVAIQFIETFDLKGGTAAFIRQLQGRCERMLGHYGQALTLFESAYVAVQEKNELLGPVVRLNESLVWMDLGAHDRAAQALQDATQGRSLLPRFEARALVLKARLARVLQHRSHNELEQAAKLAPADGWHDVRWLVACEQAMLQPVDTALATLSRVATDALNRGYRGVALMAHLRACEMAANHDPAKGLRHVRRAMQLCADAEAELLPRIDRWLQPARVLEAVGETEEACDLVRIALRWLNDVALPSLDERWREGLLTRQASNAQLINLAQRLNVKL